MAHDLHELLDDLREEKVERRVDDCQEDADRDLPSEGEKDVFEEFESIILMRVVAGKRAEHLKSWKGEVLL